MKKLSRIIKESIWSDIHKRSNGVQTRKEDDVNFLEPDGFIDYIRKNYRFDYTPVGIENRTNYSTIFIPICTAGTKNIKLGAIYFEYDEGVVYTHSSIKKYIPELWAKLDREFDLWDDDPDYRNYTIINPKDTSRKITNSFLLEVLDFIINNIDDSVRLCITKKTNESVWADIHKRSNGQAVRKEDICKTVVIDGVKYFIMKDFWGMGEQFIEENDDDWEAFAFNKMPDGSKAISGDTDAAGIFMKDKWDFDDSYDVYVIKDYLEMTPKELAKRSINDFQLYNADYFVKPILEKYVNEIYESHMSDYAKFWIEELRDSDMQNTMVISLCEGTDYSEVDSILDEFDDKEISDARLYLYPTIDNWYEDLERELIEAYEKNGWVKSETFEPDYTAGIPAKTHGLCFVEFEDDEDKDEDKDKDKELPF